MGTEVKFPMKKQEVKKTQGIGNPMCPLKKRLFTIQEAAVYLGRSTWSIRELIWKGSLPCVREGRRIHLDISDLDQWIEKRRAKNIL